MATIEEKIQSVKSGAAKSDPYVYYKSKLDEIITAVSGKTLQNNGDTSSSGEEPSEYDLIDRAWNGWTEVDPESGDTTVHSGFLTDVSNIVASINTLKSKANTHRNNFWWGDNMNYKNRPGLLNGVYTIRVNVAIEDGGGDSLDEAEKLAIQESTHNDEINGTISFHESTNEDIDILVAEAIVISDSIDNPFIATLVDDVIGARSILNGVVGKISQLDNLMGTTGDVSNGMVTSANSSGMYGHEIDQYIDSLAYATAYGAVMYATNNAGPIVDKLIGNLP